MSRTVLWLVGGGAAVIVVALALAWRGKLTEQAVIERAAGPAAAAVAPASPPASAPPTASAPASTPEAAKGPAAPPTFDVARIGPDGRAVIAGRATPGAKILLLDGGKEIATGMSDARGEWVIITQDPPLAPGQHELRVIEHVEGKAPLTSEQVIVAVVPAAKPEASARKDETLVMIAPPSGAATLVQPPSAAGLPKSGDLVMSTLDYDDRGHVTITGQAAPGTTVRAYVDDKLVAEGVTGSDGRWRLAPTAPVAQGKHTLRLDRTAPDGKPVARLELPFDRATLAPPAAGDGRRLQVVRGDNLWNIARAHYGDAWQYTTIFTANKDQIRDPDLIYPGQVFTLPKSK